VIGCAIVVPMGYPEDALAPDENLLLHRHPHAKMLIIPVLVFLPATAVAGFLVGFAQTRLDGGASFFAVIAVLVLWAIIVVWRCLIPFIRWLTTHFIVTDRRVLVRQGVITHSGIDIPMGRISNVQFRHGLVDRLLRTGTLVVVSAADDPLEFDNIPDVQKVHTLLYRTAFDVQDRSSTEHSAERAPGEGERHRKAW
jgi:uncharacterized membrane protein YdbT with pleckstrin-like domain